MTAVEADVGGSPCGCYPACTTCPPPQGAASPKKLSCPQPVTFLCSTGAIGCQSTNAFLFCQCWQAPCCSASTGRCTSSGRQPGITKHVPGVASQQRTQQRPGRRSALPGADRWCTASGCSSVMRCQSVEPARSAHSSAMRRDVRACASSPASLARSSASTSCVRGGVMNVNE